MYKFARGRCDANVYRDLDDGYACACGVFSANPVTAAVEVVDRIINAGRDHPVFPTPVSLEDRFALGSGTPVMATGSATD